MKKGFLWNNQYNGVITSISRVITQFAHVLSAIYRGHITPSNKQNSMESIRPVFLTLAQMDIKFRQVSSGFWVVFKIDLTGELAIHWGSTSLNIFDIKRGNFPPKFKKDKILQKWAISKFGVTFSKSHDLLGKPCFHLRKISLVAGGKCQETGWLATWLVWDLGTKTWIFLSGCWMDDGPGVSVKTDHF